MLMQDFETIHGSRQRHREPCHPALSQELCLAETYVSPRLLRGVVPSVLLENYSFWEGEEPSPAFQWSAGEFG